MWPKCHKQYERMMKRKWFQRLRLFQTIWWQKWPGKLDTISIVLFNWPRYFFKFFYHWQKITTKRKYIRLYRRQSVDKSTKLFLWKVLRHIVADQGNVVSLSSCSLDGKPVDAILASPIFWELCILLSGFWGLQDLSFSLGFPKKDFAAFMSYFFRIVSQMSLIFSSMFRLASCRE